MDQIFKEEKVTIIRRKKSDCQKGKQYKIELPNNPMLNDKI